MNFCFLLIKILKNATTIFTPGDQYSRFGTDNIIEMCLFSYGYKKFKIKIYLCSTRLYFIICEIIVVLYNMICIIYRIPSFFFFVRYIGINVFNVDFYTQYFFMHKIDYHIIYIYSLQYVLLRNGRNNYLYKKKKPDTPRVLCFILLKYMKVRPRLTAAGVVVGCNYSYQTERAYIIYRRDLLIFACIHRMSFSPFVHAILYRYIPPIGRIPLYNTHARTPIYTSEIE